MLIQGDHPAVIQEHRQRVCGCSWIVARRRTASVGSRVPSGIDLTVGQRLLQFRNSVVTDFRVVKKENLQPFHSAEMVQSGVGRMRIAERQILQFG